MPENSKTQSITMLGGVNIAPTQTKKPRGRPPKPSAPEEPKPTASVPPPKPPAADPPPDPPD